MSINITHAFVLMASKLKQLYLTVRLNLVPYFTEKLINNLETPPLKKFKIRH